jgi:hypothetical protein
VQLKHLIVQQMFDTGDVRRDWLIQKFVLDRLSDSLYFVVMASDSLAQCFDGKQLKRRVIYPGMLEKAVPDDGNSDFEFYPETKHQSSYSFGF